MCLFVEKLLSFKKSMRPRAKRSLKEPSRDAITVLNAYELDCDSSRFTVIFFYLF